MKTLVIYDSAFGNTEKVAQAIGSAVGGESKVLLAGVVDASTLGPVDFLFVGSPTQNGKPTKALSDFLNALPDPVLKGAKAAAFDTRLSGRLVTNFGTAATRLAATLQARGAVLISTPEGFIVGGKEGPLKEGELDRAARWAKETVGALSAERMLAGAR